MRKHWFRELWSFVPYRFKRSVVKTSQMNRVDQGFLAMVNIRWLCIVASLTEDLQSSDELAGAKCLGRVSTSSLILMLRRGRAVLWNLRVTTKANERLWI